LGSSYKINKPIAGLLSFPRGRKLRRHVIGLFLISLITGPSAVAFIDIQQTPYAVAEELGTTIQWDESYLITVDDMQVRLVVGDARLADASGSTTLNWDPEIVSIEIDGDEVMRRFGIGGEVENDPLSQMPFLGIGGLTSPYNRLLGFDPPGTPPATFRWIEDGSEDLVSWETTYEYAPGDVIVWLNRTFVLNSTLNVKCTYEMTSEYQAIGQRIVVTNGDGEQYLPFPVETSFSLGSRLRGRGISLPIRTLESDNHLIYPASELPAGWYNETYERYLIPETMWEEGDLPGMLYYEFEIPSERNWYGIATESDLAYEILTGIGLRILSTQGMENLHAYCILLSGARDSIIFGLKPHGSPGPYGSFEPLLLSPGEAISVDLLWFFPEAVEGEMSIAILNDFGSIAIAAGEFNDLREEAQIAFDEANDLASKGDVDGAITRSRESLSIYRELSALSSALEEDERLINGTIKTWMSAAADRTPHPDNEGRPAIFISVGTVLGAILVLAAWIYIIEPRRSSSE
jgi:hypothetical protein